MGKGPPQILVTYRDEDGDEVVYDTAYCDEHAREARVRCEWRHGRDSNPIYRRA